MLLRTFTGTLNSLSMYDFWMSSVIHSCMENKLNTRPKINRHRLIQHGFISSMNVSAFSRLLCMREWIFYPGWFMCERREKMKKHEEMSKGDIQAATNSQIVFQSSRNWQGMRNLRRKLSKAPKNMRLELQSIESNFTAICLN